MQRILVIGALLVLATGIPGFKGAASPESPSETQPVRSEKTLVASTRLCTERAQAFLDYFFEGNYQAAMTNADSGLRAKLKAVQLQNLSDGFGKLLSRGTAQGSLHQGKPVIAVPLEFEAGALAAHISCDKNGEIGDFDLVSIRQAPLERGASSRFRETEIEIGNPPLALDAIVTMPIGKGPFAGVVLVSGAGQNDHDETFRPYKPMRDIAHGLAALGIATLRYDKPTFDHSIAFFAKPYTIDDEFTVPAIEAFKRLRSTPGINPRDVFVLGHSQGGEMAPRIAQREPLISGLILINAPAQSLREYFQSAEQSSSHLISLYPQFAAEIRRQAEITRATRIWLAQVPPNHPDAVAPDGEPAVYWLSLRDYKNEMMAVAKALKQPMLILQGGSDDSVSPTEDFPRWQQAFAHDPRVTLREYPGLSHLMTPAGDPPSPADYARSAQVDPQVIADIAAWIHAHARQ